jgi:hypothetical protein
VRQQGQHLSSSHPRATRLKHPPLQPSLPPPAPQLEQAADKQLLNIVRTGLGGRGGAGAGASGGVAGAPPAAGGGGGSGSGALPMQVLGTLRGVASGALASALLGRRNSSSDAAGGTAPVSASPSPAPGGGGSQGATSPSPQPQQQQPPPGGAPGDAYVPGSLKKMMGLPDVPAGPPPERSLPSEPTKVFPSAHKGIVCGVAVMRPGAFLLLEGGLFGLQAVAQAAPRHTLEGATRLTCD